MELQQLRHDLALARRMQAHAGAVAVLLHFLAKLIETAVPAPGAGGRFGIDFVEIPQHRFHRGAQAVQVQPVESGALLHRQRLVMGSQPPDEVEHIGVAPHPGRKSAEVGKRLHGVRVSARPSHVAIDAIGVGPVGFDRHGRKSLLDNQPASDERALSIEFVRAVRRFAEEHDTRISDALDQRVVLRRIAFQHNGAVADRRQGVGLSPDRWRAG